MWIVTKENELMHYGVKGMKWGVRRVEKLRKKAREYDKYSKEFKKEGSRRYGSDGAAYKAYQTDFGKKEAAVILGVMGGVAATILATKN